MAASTLAAKHDQVLTTVRGLGRVIVAYSGGVDSTLLLRLCLDAVGSEQVLAALDVSESLPERDKEEAVETANDLGARLTVVSGEEFSDPRFLANPDSRCYYCKSDLYGKLVRLAEDHGYRAVLDGSNSDDTGDWRPGRQAAAELGVRSPLLEAAMSKDDIRELSRRLGLPTWDRPSKACLASRIPYGTPITPEALAAIEAAENLLADLGFGQLRVRHHGEVARIEVPAEDLPRLVEPEIRSAVAEGLRALGFRHVTADLAGYRTGSMNPR